MITISEVIEGIIKKQPFLEEELHRGIINLSALARRMKPQVEKKLMKPVKTGAIMMALKRMTPTITKKLHLKQIFAKNPNMLVRSHLTEYTIGNSPMVGNKIQRLYQNALSQHKYFFTITQGVFETAIIASDEMLQEIEHALSEEKIIKKIENLSSLTLILPEENVHTPGVYYFILKTLAWENINVIDVVSTYTEFTIILKEEEIDRAFSILKKS
jgi:ribosomal protein L30E